MISVVAFQKTIWSRYRSHPRPMPWRRTRDPYRILVSEVMLQQTQVARVADYYGTFIKTFPDFRALARAKTADVLLAWQGLGYNRRALALQKLAREVVERYGGKLPRGGEALMKLPGVGPYTAGAIRAFAFNEPDIFIETNIRRVFIHFFFPIRGNRRKNQASVTDAAIRRYIERTLDKENPREWYWALMDYGAMLGEAARSAPGVGRGQGNPNRRSAQYVRQSAFSGSDREIRGDIVRNLLAKKKVVGSALIKSYAEPPARVSKILDKLAREGFLSREGKYITLE